MVYDLNTAIDRERFRRRAEALMVRRAVVECSERKPRRSSPQNRYLHCILGEFAIETGNTLEYVKAEYFKRHCNPELFVRVEHDKLTHRDVERLRSSRDLDTGEMTTAIERSRNWAAMAAGIDLPSPDDREWTGFIEREMQHKKHGYDMANNKIGLNYYNVDTDRYMDIRIRRLVKNHGCKGLAVYDFLLCEVYRVQGCFVVWDESTAFNVAEYLGLKESNVSEIVRYCGAVGLFDKELLSRGIITSASIQRRYLEICSRAKRKIAEIPEECRIIPEESQKTPEVCREERKKERNISSSSSSSRARTREEYSDFTEIVESESIPPEKSCAKKAPPPPLPDGTYEDIPVAAIAEYLTGDEVWIEALCMNKHLDRAYVEAKIRDFAAECQNNGETAKDKRDCKRHFNNWLRKSQQYEQNQRILSHGRRAKNQPPSPDELARAVAEGISRAHTRQEWE